MHINQKDLTVDCAKSGVLFVGVLVIRVQRCGFCIRTQDFWKLPSWTMKSGLLLWIVVLVVLNPESPDTSLLSNQGSKNTSIRAFGT